MYHGIIARQNFIVTYTRHKADNISSDIIITSEPCTLINYIIMFAVGF